MSGIRLALGILSRDGFNRYRQGEFGKTEEDKRAYMDVFAWGSLVIESYCEEELFREKGQVQGVIKALENKYGWRDVRHLSVEHKEKAQLIVQIPQCLADKLTADAGEPIGTIIEGDFSEKKRT